MSDFSSLKSHPQLDCTENEKILRTFKIETMKTISGDESSGVRSKMYKMKGGDEEQKNIKGITKAIKEKEFQEPKNR